MNKTNKNKTLSYFLVRLNDMKLLIIINTVLGAFAFILFAAITAYYSHLDQQSYQAQFFNIEPFIAISGFSGLGIILLSYGIGIESFKYLHNKNICDMHLSLPLNHTSRFLMNFAAGLSAIVAPYMLTSALGILTLRLFGNMNLIEELLHLDGYSFATVVTKYLIPGILTGLLVLIMVYVLSVFCCSICGKSFMVAAYPFIFSAVIPLTIFTMASLSTYATRGMDVNFQQYGEYAMIITSPIAFLYGNLAHLENGSDLMIKLPIYTVPAILFCIILSVAAFFISKRVKAENIGRDLLFKLVYNIQQFAICFCITSVFVMTMVDAHVPGSVVTWMFIITGVIFFVGDIIHHRGAKGLKKAILKYIAAMMATFIICTAVYHSNGFGRGNYVPSAGEIQSISIRYNNAYHSRLGNPQNYIFEHFPNPNGNIFNIDSTTEARWQTVSEQAVRLHRAIINAPGNDHFNVWITFELKNGLTIRRYYNSVNLDKLIEEGVLTNV
jgi:hypothetical protein